MDISRSPSASPHPPTPSGHLPTFLPGPAELRALFVPAQYLPPAKRPRLSPTPQHPALPPLGNAPTAALLQMKFAREREEAMRNAPPPPEGFINSRPGAEPLDLLAEHIARAKVAHRQYMERKKQELERYAPRLTALLDGAYRRARATAEGGGEATEAEAEAQFLNM